MLPEVSLEPSKVRPGILVDKCVMDDVSTDRVRPLFRFRDCH